MLLRRLQLMARHARLFLAQAVQGRAQRDLQVGEPSVSQAASNLPISRVPHTPLGSKLSLSLSLTRHHVYWGGSKI